MKIKYTCKDFNNYDKVHNYLIGLGIYKITGTTYEHTKVEGKYSIYQGRDEYINVGLSKTQVFYNNDFVKLSEPWEKIKDFINISNLKRK